MSTGVTVWKPVVVALGLAAAMVTTSVTSVDAQAAPTLASVEGVAYDSLARRPLPNAMIAVEGTGRSAISDGKGRFRIDSVPEGMRVFMMQHAAFDSLGLSGTAVRVLVEKKTPRVVLAVPSFETLWRAACGDVRTPKDSGLVFGTVRDASTLDATANVAVDGSWVDLVGGGKSLSSVGQRRWRRAATSDARGEFALCGVPASTALTLRAQLDSTRVTSIELAPTQQRVQRRDLLVSRAIVAETVTAAGTVDTTLASSRPTPPAGPSGTVTGFVTNASGLPVANAAVAVDSLAEVRTGEDGRFHVRHVPIGTRQISIVAIGMSPYTATFDLRDGDTTRLTIPMTSVQTLSEMSVKATTVANMRERTLEEHKRLGLGHFRDSTFLATVPSMQSALRSIPSVFVNGTPAKFSVVSQGCKGGFRVYVDGHPSTLFDIAVMDMQAVAALEVYTRKLAPVDIPGATGCAILLWTKFGMRKE